ncbi:NTP transferase domain-containing protein, partial [Candidatus Woesearchaeota archaeon]|nr:NTP transferase domain-containing protein [Candidatus Woesearchaeota archaeon]
MQAIILAAGRGTRIGEGDGSSLPKVMYKIQEIPMIQYSVDNLRAAGVREVIVVVGYKREMVQNYLGN